MSINPDVFESVGLLLFGPHPKEWKRHMANLLRLTDRQVRRYVKDDLDTPPESEVPDIYREIIVQELSRRKATLKADMLKELQAKEKAYALHLRLLRNSDGSVDVWTPENDL